MTPASQPVPFIPPGYLRQCHEGFCLWHDPGEPRGSLHFALETMSFAVAWLRSKLDFAPKRSLHLCLYHSNEVAASTLERDVPANMAMAPFSSEEASLVIIQSQRAHPMNGDSDRMGRVLVHEVCHLFVREQTNSWQILGDGLRNLRLRPWLDEGFAETLSRQAVGAPPLELHEEGEAWTAAELDRHLCDLSSSRREAAFVEATRVVSRFVEELGAVAVFNDLVKISSRSDELVGFIAGGVHAPKRRLSSGGTTPAFGSLCAPPGARPAARVILIGQDQRVLLLEGAMAGDSWWVMPGGGVEASESFADAAVRETLEETGIRVEVSNCVWVRQHLKKAGFHQYEQFFVARTQEVAVRPRSQDSYITGHRWWSLDEIAMSSLVFAPRRLACLLPQILSGDLPTAPIDVGV